MATALRQSYPADLEPSWAPLPDPQTAAYHIRLDELLDVLQSTSATGLDWTNFSYYACVPSLLYLHGDVWRELSHELLEEMARSVGLAYAQRFEALRILLDHKIAHSWLLRAAEEYLNDPVSPCIEPAMRVLAVSDSEEAADILLDALTHPTSEAVLAASTSAVAHKVELGGYEPAALRQIEAALLHEIGRRRDVIDGLEEAIVAMPEATRTSLIKAAESLRGHDGLVIGAAYGEWVAPDLAQRVSQQIADEVRSRLPSGGFYDQDAMTPRIIREAIFAVRGERREHARLALLGSPFRRPVAVALTAHLEAASWDDSVTPRLLRLLRHLAGPEQEPALVSWLAAADDRAAPVLALALGHLPPSSADLGVLVDWLDDGQTTRGRAALYALGMRREPAVSEIAEDPARSEVLRAAATWWLERGGAVDA